MTNKDITGGEVEALKREAVDDFINARWKWTTPQSLVLETVNYLASKGHLKTTGGAKNEKN